jgi:hypothetical protein
MLWPQKPLVTAQELQHQRRDRIHSLSRVIVLRHDSARTVHKRFKRGVHSPLPFFLNIRFASIAIKKDATQ